MPETSLLVKQPKTELEYWEAIEALGGLQWRLNHDLSDGRIDDPSGGVASDIARLQTELEKLVGEACEKFGVIHPKDTPRKEPGQPEIPAPEGKTYYWDWYNAMKIVSYQAEYDQMICAGCPYSEGAEMMMRRGGQIPCSIFRGSLYRLRVNYICGMTGYDEVPIEEIYSRIEAEHGAEALTRFKDKEAELKSKAEKKKVTLIVAQSASRYRDTNQPEQDQRRVDFTATIEEMPLEIRLQFEPGVLGNCNLIVSGAGVRPCRLNGEEVFDQFGHLYPMSLQEIETYVYAESPMEKPLHYLVAMANNLTNRQIKYLELTSINGEVIQYDAEYGNGIIYLSPPGKGPSEAQKRLDEFISGPGVLEGR